LKNYILSIYSFSKVFILTKELFHAQHLCMKKNYCTKNSNICASLYLEAPSLCIVFVVCTIKCKICAYIYPFASISYNCLLRNKFSLPSCFGVKMPISAKRLRYLLAVLREAMFLSTKMPILQ
jgi:hypothetical protein